MFRKKLINIFLVLMFTVSILFIPNCTHQKQYDIVIYGGTSAGVVAAIQAARMQKSVVLIEPGKHLGGLTSGGLGQTDIGNKKAIGGIAREFYHRVFEYYMKDESWVQQKREEYQAGKDWYENQVWWKFEPHVAEKIFRDMIREAKVPVVFEERLDLKNSVHKQGTKITAIRMESGKIFRGQVFIDATYEGDLMAKTGVSYTVGREANAVYGETLNGVQTKNAVHHQLQDFINPYIEPGQPSSGLLPGIDPTGPDKEGSGDHRVQAYCFRMCMSDAPENRVPFEKPAGYDSLQYELLFRNFEAGEDGVPLIISMMPNRKTDTNNKHGFSTDYIGQNYDWPEADYTTREKIYRKHLLYQQGLMWTLANHPRVPEKIRQEVSRWGLAKDEFTDNGHWPHQLYIREARRMIGEYVMTEHNCRGVRVAPQTIGLAAYTMDSHNVQRYITKEGFVKNEGNVEVGGFPPYPISYKSLTPKASECTNLLVPVCLSASHIAYGSIRMEPVFMVLGQSAAMAACMAIDMGANIQNVDYAVLRKQLLLGRQILEWTQK
ncbi:MAG: FAD-dependent oxidoreductase [Actinobacteria bacterium]|nr:FAD-dependent oxidoreductase [Actinomycetota bacterium]